jgi:SET domain-containing protein
MHSRVPCCLTLCRTVDGEKCVGVFAIKDIAENEEVTMDYQWSRVGSMRVRCACGSPLCQGFIGGAKDMSDGKPCALRCSLNW